MSQSKSVFSKPGWDFRNYIELTTVLARLGLNYIILSQRDLVIKCVEPSKALCWISSALWQ